METHYIFIRGTMGAGKSAVAACLAKELDCPLVCGDDCWAWSEEPTARQKEEVIENITLKLNALYGKEYVIFEWVMHLNETVKQIKNNLSLEAIVSQFILSADEETLKKRILSSGGGLSKVKRALARKKQMQSEQDTVIINTDNITAEQAANYIKEQLC